MNPIAIQNWQEFRRDGEQFLNTALRAHEKKKKGFSPETLYNLTCMAIEKIIMAFLMKNGDLAQNHTMADLLFSLEEHLGNNSEIAEKLLWLDSFQEICDLDEYTIQTPGPEETSKILNIGSDIYSYLRPQLD